MKEAEVLQRINGVAEDLIEEASTFTVQKKKRWKVILPSAAAVLLILGTLSGLLYYNSNKVKLDEDGRIDIYSLKNAEMVKEDDLETIANIGISSEAPGPAEEYIALHRERIAAGEEAFVYGTAKNVKMIKIDSWQKISSNWESVIGEDNVIMRWCIVTFDIDVIDVIHNNLPALDKKETIHVVMASEHAVDGDYSFINFHLIQPVDLERRLKDIQNNPTGLFLLRNQTAESEMANIWNINGKDYRGVDFADFFVAIKYDYDGGETFRYHKPTAYTTVNLNEFRIKEE